MKKTLTLLALGAFAGVAAQAAVIASYSLGSTLAEDSGALDSNIASASNLSFANINSLGFDGIGIEFDGLPSYPAKTDYVTVTLTANSGFLINLNQVTFAADYISGSRTGDGYTVDVISDPSGTPVTQTLGSSEDGETEFDSGTIVGFSAAEVVELRVYWNNGQSWGDQQMGSLVFDGTVSAVPEPSSYALLAGALALGWVMVRRRS